MKALLIALALFACGSAQAGICTITEFVQLPQDPQGRTLYMATLGPNTPGQQLTYGASTRITTALANATTFIRVWCDSEARIAVGDVTIVADDNDMGLSAGSEVFINVPFILNASNARIARYVAIYDSVT